MINQQKVMLMKEHSVEINNFLVGYENHISPSLMSALIHRMNQSSDFHELPAALEAGVS